MTKQEEFEHYYPLMKRQLMLHGMAKKTVQAYLYPLVRVHERLNVALSQLTPEILKGYFAELLEADYSWSTIKTDVSALRFFSTYVLQREWEWVQIVKPPKMHTVPDILSREEVIHLIKSVEKERYRVCLMAIYSMGLRLNEGVSLKVGDICAERMRVHVRLSKNHKDRLVPLPQVTLKLLRRFWTTHRNPTLLFPQPYAKKKATTDKHMHPGSMQAALKQAVNDCGLRKKVTVHTLRHSYATHLVEHGIHLRVIQMILGHSSPTTTAVYTHLTESVHNISNQSIEELMKPFEDLL